MSNQRYTVGWICAITTEYVAAQTFLDEKHEPPSEIAQHDNNAYALGTIGKHNVVIAVLPDGEYGTNSAATVARDMLHSFPNIRIGLMVGIGGGAPSSKHDIRLGDVVVSSPRNGRSGVLQYDFGKAIQDHEFLETGLLDQPSSVLRTAVAALRGIYESDGHQIEENIEQILQKKPRLKRKYFRPPDASDRLYASNHTHQSPEDDCSHSCGDDPENLVSRHTRTVEEGEDNVTIHYGQIASANRLMKDARIRDKLAAEKGVLCFEMEAAGLINHFPCLVIRGVCDYADSHKNKEWQGFAAMTAAAYAKDLLQQISPNKVEVEKRIEELLSNVVQGTEDTKNEIRQIRSQHQLSHLHGWLSPADPSTNLNKALKLRHEGSGRWFLESHEYLLWQKEPSSFLWLNGKPGCGKTILSSTIIEDHQNSISDANLLYYYFDFSDTTKQSLDDMIRSLTWQLYSQSSEDVQSHLQSLYSSHQNGTSQPSTNALDKTFQSMLEKSGRLRIVLDALDECSIEKGSGHPGLLDWIQNLCRSNRNVSVLTTSRPEQDIHRHFTSWIRNDEMIQLQSNVVFRDISRYIQDRVHNHKALSRWQGHPDTQKEIETALVEKADGMFRWVTCQLDALENCLDYASLQRALHSLPPTLDETYNRIFRAIPACYLPHTKRLLQFLAFSKRPLRVEEAVDAIAVGVKSGEKLRFDPRSEMPVPHEILRYGSGLISIVEKNRMVDEIQLSHFSVKEWLLSNRLVSDLAADSGLGYSELLGTTKPSHMSVDVDSAYGSNQTVQDKDDERPRQPAELDDAATQYSDESSTTNSRRKDYIFELASYLFVETRPSSSDLGAEQKMCTALPDLLKAFALKLGHCAPTQRYLDIMAFVHRNRRDIATAFKDLADGALDDVKESVRGGFDDLDSMSLDERMRKWEDWSGEISQELFEEDETRYSEPSSELIEETIDVPHEDDSEDDVIPENEAWAESYRLFLSNTEAFKWLLGQLRNQSNLEPGDPDIIQKISNKVISSLSPNPTISRKASSQTYTVKFEVDWDAFQFFASQKYPCRSQEALEGVITITGSDLDAQAATCAQYLDQTWPVTGMEMLELIKRALEDEESICHSTFRDKTRLSANIVRSQLVVEATGIAISLAETAEQLAWLGATLQTPRQPDGLTICIPTITDITQQKVTLSISCARTVSPEVVFKIGFDIEQERQFPNATNGQCWHNAFNSPVIVKGYPITRRAEWGTGLEIPLNVMAALLKTQRLEWFGERVYIKGFSSMMVPIKQYKDTLYWHLIYNEDGSRISYLDDRVNQCQYIGSPDMAHLHHVLGWCSQAKTYAGSAKAHYSVTRAKLKSPQVGDVFYNKFYELGQIITGGPAFQLGTKDISVKNSPNHYVGHLNWLATKLVLLWDDRDKRGWLVNGTTALLHIVRAFIEHQRKSVFGAACVFDVGRVQESEKFGSDSAIEVLINKENLELEVFQERGKYLNFQKIIDEFISILEKLIEHQKYTLKRNGQKLHATPRERLQGWDYHALVTNHYGEIPARIATLERGGKSWVDFIRAQHVVTLLGWSFGELIRPADENICSHWANLPKQHYYIASCLSDLTNTMEKYDINDDGHVRLSENLVWHSPTDMFVSCLCKDALHQNHSEPVQTIFPSALSEKLPPRVHPIPREFQLQQGDEYDGNHRAFIFGHNSNFPWVWKNHGEPEGNSEELTAPLSSTSTDSKSQNDSKTILTLAKSDSIERKSSSSKSSTELSRIPSGIYDSAVKPGLRYSSNDYKVGIICPLWEELRAVRSLFDEDHDGVDTPFEDSNQYVFGRMAGHMVVAAGLPAGKYGTNPAAAVATHMTRSFQLDFCLLVGIGGGVPSDRNPIRLGDVVVGVSNSGKPAVIQYDFGKETEGGFLQTGMLRSPDCSLLSAITKMQSDCPKKILMRQYIAQITDRHHEYNHPDQKRDGVVYSHTEFQSPPELLSTDGDQKRIASDPDDPRIYYGTIASGNSVIKDASFRDRLGDAEGVLCFEMEAAGVTDRTNCVVIRGISDLCDGNKNDVWRNYAAATAAAYSKLLLGVIKKNPST